MNEKARHPVDLEPVRIQAGVPRKRSGEASKGAPRGAIPSLPERPRVLAIDASVRRSYSVGRMAFTRAYVGRVFEVTISTNTPAPAEVQLSLDTTLNAPITGEWITMAFERTEERTFRCRLKPQRPGFFGFRAKASMDCGRTWIHDAVPVSWVMVDPPQIDGLRMYTLIPAVSGTIADWSEDLPRIRDLGFNAVHLLPVTSLDESQSPYAARDLFDIDHAYLIDGAGSESLDQLEKFVHRARDLGVALCFDLVLNHVGVRSTMARRAPAWIVPDQDRPDGNKRARYWFENHWRTWEDLVLINYEHPNPAARAEIWEYMTQYALFWAQYASYTGGLVRFDNLHSSNSEFIRTVAARLSREHPFLGVVVEYFTDDVTLLSTVPDWGLNLVLAMPRNFRFVPELRNYLRYVQRLSEHIRYFMPITSHDSGSPAQEFGAAESTVPRCVAAALLGTGSKGMPQGVEWGVPEKIDFIGVKSREAHSGEPRFAHLIRSVNGLLAAQPAFRRGGNCVFVDNEHHAIIAAFRRDPDQPDGGFLIACNFDIHRSQRVTCDLTGAMGFGGGRIAGRERLDERQAMFDSPVISLNMPPCGATAWELRPA